MVAGHRFVDLVRRPIGRSGRPTKALGIGQRFTEAAQTLIQYGFLLIGRLFSIWPRALDGIRFDLADRVLKRQSLARDVGFIEPGSTLRN